MTDIERANKVYAARLKYGDGKPRKFIHELPFKHDISVGRKTPKSKRLLEIEAFNRRTIFDKAVMDSIIETMVFGSGMIKVEHIPMVDVYTGSDLGHFNHE